MIYVWLDSCKSELNIVNLSVKINSKIKSFKLIHIWRQKQFYLRATKHVKIYSTPLGSIYAPSKGKSNIQVIAVAYWWKIVLKTCFFINLSRVSCNIQHQWGSKNAFSLERCYFSWFSFESFDICELVLKLVFQVGYIWKYEIL